jgi:hypothetical protein
MNFKRFETCLNWFRKKYEVKRKRALCQQDTLHRWLQPGPANGLARPGLVAHYEDYRGGQAQGQGGGSTCHCWHPNGEGRWVRWREHDKGAAMQFMRFGEDGPHRASLTMVMILGDWGTPMREVGRQSLPGLVGLWRITGWRWRSGRCRPGMRVAEDVRRWCGVHWEQCGWHQLWRWPSRWCFIGLSTAWRTASCFGGFGGMAQRTVRGGTRCKKRCGAYSREGDGFACGKRWGAKRELHLGSEPTQAVRMAPKPCTQHVGGEISNTAMSMWPAADRSGVVQSSGDIRCLVRSASTHKYTHDGRCGHWLGG